MNSKLTDFEQLRRERNRRTLIRRLVIFTAATLLIFTGFYLFRVYGDMGFQGGLASLAEGFTKGPGYPVPTSREAAVSLQAIGEDAALLGDITFSRFTSSGKKIMEIPHGMYDPAMAGAGDRVLLYDRGGRTLEVHSRAKELFSTTMDGDIIAADIARNGNLAAATGSRGYLGEVVVYNKNFSEIYRYFSADGMISAISLSDYEDRMALGRVDTRDGVLNSTIVFYKFTTDQPVANVLLEDQMVLSLDYKGPDGTLYAITDKNVYAISPEGEILGRFSFGGEPLWAFDNSSGTSIALALGNYRERRSLSLYRLGENLEPAGPVRIGGRMISLRSDSKGLYALCDSTLTVFDTAMNQTAVREVPDAKAIQPVNGTVYIYSKGVLDRWRP